MKKILLIFIFSSLSIHFVKAQENPPKKGLGLGGQISQYQRDFGIGISATSPYFVPNTMAVRLRGNLMFFQHVKDGSETWTRYFNVTAGIFTITGCIGENIKLYGEGGVIGLIPSSEFSDEGFVFGGFGLFGFEFYMSHATNYFIEIGGVGTGATADKIATSPIYSNGFMISAGFRAVLY